VNINIQLDVDTKTVLMHWRTAYKAIFALKTESLKRYMDFRVSY